MIHLLNVEEWAERYNAQDLTPDELRILHKTLEEDAVLNRAFEQALKMQLMLQEHRRTTRLKSKLAIIAEQHRRQAAANAAAEERKGMRPSGRLKVQLKKYWRPMTAAAVIALCSSLLTYNLSRDTKNKNDQYVLLKRDIESIKKSQNQIISEMKQTETNAAAKAVVPEGVYGGSGFAISNDGYFATNYHVVERADSIYLQMNNGKAYKAIVIKVDPEADLAILKVDDKDFTFKQGIPYTIDKQVASLGQRIFTIGYPKEDVVYNEGYIASEKGYGGNTLAYQLEIIANPGQSGAPILDHTGNVVGVITGKQSNTSGTTFAVHAEQLLSMISELPKDYKINLNSKNKYQGVSRPEQVKMLRDYVCAVKVY